jgi:hypothetical protein
MMKNNLYKPPYTTNNLPQLDFYTTRKMYILIFRLVGAGLGDDWFET